MSMQQPHFHIAKRAKVMSPPRDEWPGRPVTEEDVEYASGDHRDLFTREQRLEAHHRLEASFQANYSHRELSEEWTCNLVLGPMGRGKTSWLGCDGFPEYGVGRPLFSVNCSLLAGNILAADEVYTALPRLPFGSTLNLDEGHVLFGSGGGGDNSHHTIMALQAFALLRKRNIRLNLGTAKPRLLSNKVKEEADHIIVPEPPELGIQEETHQSYLDYHRRRLGLERKGRAPASSAVYRLGFWQFDTNPFRQDDTLQKLGLEDKWDPDEELEKSYYLIDPLQVREAKLLIDSFGDISLGLQFLTPRDLIKDTMRAMLFGGEIPDAPGIEEAKAQQFSALWKLKLELEAKDLPDKAKLGATDLAKLAGAEEDVKKFAAAMREALNLTPDSRGKYRYGDLTAALDVMWEGA